jgi:hypothetical protein
MRMASAMSTSWRKRARANSLSTAHLLSSVGAMLTGGEGGCWWLAAGKEGFWVPMTGTPPV